MAVAKWSDSEGNLWVFGGSGCDANGFCDQYNNVFNDLWQYDISSSKWTWVGGSNLPNQSGVYGTKGIAAETNIPGGRFYSMSTADNNGNLWLFGGGGIINDSTRPRNLNDLWKYDLSSESWTWVSGESLNEQFGVYGSLGVESSTNLLGARNGGSMWTDKHGDIWIFGGQGCDSESTSQCSDYLNDLWEYNTSTKLWTWQSGSEIGNKSGVYGQKGESALDNTPGARRDATSWTDNQGNLWLFGGNGYAGDVKGYLSDLWKYDVSNKSWTWVGGSNLINESGEYGVQGIPSTDNLPPSRYGSSSWTDNNGDLWLFAGSAITGSENDLWEYSISNNTWTWVSGSKETDQYGNYGTIRIPSLLDNMAGSRYNAAGFEGKNGDFWVFGGYGCDTDTIQTGCNVALNDLWNVVPFLNPSINITNQ